MYEVHLNSWRSSASGPPLKGSDSLDTVGKSGGIYRAFKHRSFSARCGTCSNSATHWNWWSLNTPHFFKSVTGFLSGRKLRMPFYEIPTWILKGHFICFCNCVHQALFPRDVPNSQTIPKSVILIVRDMSVPYFTSCILIQYHFNLNEAVGKSGHVCFEAFKWYYLCSYICMSQIYWYVTECCGFKDKPFLL